MIKKILKNNKFQTVAWIFLIIFIWEIAAKLGFTNKYLLPPFSDVMINLFNELGHGTLGLQVVNSLLIVLEGFILSFVLTIILTIACVYSDCIKSLCNALCTIMNPLPGIAILPLVMMWFGVNNGAMIFLIVHGVVWPLLNNLLTGFRSTPIIYKDFAKNIGLKPFKVATDILFFSVMPYFISGIRIGWGRAWRALISAEMLFGMIGTLGGLGFYIYTARAYANIHNVLGGVIIIIIIGLLMEQIFESVEKRTVRKWGMTNE